MKYIQIVVPAILIVILSLSCKKAAAQSVCSSPYLDSPQNRKLCLTLANFFGIPSSLETYSDDLKASYGYKNSAGYKGKISADFLDTIPNMKRQDVDHVFLRFGRRR